MNDERLDTVTKALLLGFALLLSSAAHAQSTFRKTIGGPGADVARAVIQLPDGGYLVAGSTQDSPGAQDDALLIRLNAQGDVVWQRTYGGAASEVFTDCCVGNDGGFLCLGQTRSYGAGGLDIWFVKVDDTGTVQWSETFGSTTDDQSAYLVPLPPSGYVTASNGTNGSGSQFDASAIRINNLGQLIWSRSYSNGTDNLAILWADPNASEIWAGGIQYNGNGFDGILLSLDANSGEVTQAHTYAVGGLYFNFPTPDGDLFAADGSALPNTNERWAWAVKTNPIDGSVRWSYLYGIPGQNYRSRAIPALDGGFALTMIDPTLNPAHTTTDATVAHIDLEGNLLWAYDYGGSGADRLFDIQPTRDSGFVFCGAYFYQNPAEQDILLVKTDREGQLSGCCPSSTPLARRDRPSVPTQLAVPTLPWAAAVEQNLSAVSPISISAKTLPCIDVGPNSEVFGWLLVCDEEQGGEIEMSATCKCQFSLNDGPFQSEYKFDNLDTGTYKITIQSEFGCRRDTFIVLKINTENIFFEMPNAFTPNGDGTNDRFRPAASPKCPATVRLLQIYDRWGKRVFEQRDFKTSDASAGWDGLLDGLPAPADVYAYVVSYVAPDGKTKNENGNTTLLR